jgi:hypothetical protein
LLLNWLAADETKNLFCLGGEDLFFAYRLDGDDYLHHSQGGINADHRTGC